MGGQLNSCAVEQAYFLQDIPIGIKLIECPTAKAW